MKTIIKRCLLIIMILGVMGCNSGLIEEKEGLEKRNSFLDSLVKIGQGFQEIFNSFGSAIGNAFGVNAIKPEDKRSKVGEHFKTIGDGLKNTKDKLDELAKQIVSTPNADTKGVEAVIQGFSEVIAEIMTAVNKLTGVTKDVNTDIGDSASAAAAVAADKTSVDAVIEGIKEIIETAKKSGVNIEKGIAGGEVAAGANTSAPAVLAANAGAGAGASSKLVEEVAKADPWAMIDKIKNAKTKQGNLGQNDNNDAGELATGTPGHANGAKAATNADLAAAVALKAMTKSGKFSAAAGEDAVIKVAAASAVNKVLGIFDIIIRKTLSIHLAKVREAVKEIKYSETSETSVPEAGIVRPATT
nr:variable large family protein [Borrelia persica]